MRSARAHHIEQMRATSRRHAEQMDRMESHHAEQLLVLVEKDSGVEAARDHEGNLTGGLHHEGQFIAPPGVSASAVADTLPPPQSDKPDQK